MKIVGHICSSMYTWWYGSIILYKNIMLLALGSWPKMTRKLDLLGIWRINQRRNVENMYKNLYISLWRIQKNRNKYRNIKWNEMLNQILSFIEFLLRNLQNSPNMIPLRRSWTPMALWGMSPVGPPTLNRDDGS